MNTAEIQELIKENYLDPQNYGVPLWKPTHAISVDNPTCGDSLTLYINEIDGIVEDIAFTAAGCSISIASSSLLYSTLKGKSLEDIKKLSDVGVIALLGFEPTTSRKNCALLPLFALQKISQ